MILPLTFTLLVTPGPSEFGLVEGASYTYEVRNQGQKPFRYTATVGKQLVVQGIDTFDIQLSTKVHEFLGVSKDGLFEFYVANMEGTRIDAEAAPIPLYLRKYDVGKHWTWIEPFRGQVMLDDSGKAPDLKKLNSSCVGTIVSRDEALGKWKTLHIRIDRTSEGLGNSRTDTWYAPGVGKVRELRTSKDWRSETVLVD